MPRRGSNTVDVSGIWRQARLARGRQTRSIYDKDNGSLGVLNDEQEMPEARLDNDEASTGIIKPESEEEVGSGDP